MTPKKEQFSIHTLGNFGSVYIGNDRECVVVGMRQVQIAMDNGGVRMQCDVRHIPELRKNLILLSTVQANDFSYRTDGDRDTLRVCNGVLTMMKAQ